MGFVRTFTPAQEAEGRQESLVLALQGLSRFYAGRLRAPAGYDLIAALTGVSFVTATSFGQPCPAWWILGSRNCFLEFAAEHIGLELRLLGRQSEESDREAQIACTKEELLPRIAAEIDAGRPVLVQGGFPSVGWGLWGVAVRHEEGRVSGYTCWFRFEEQPIGEEFPVLAAYAVGPRERPRKIPMKAVVEHARDLYQNRGQVGWTTGPRAYDLWLDQLAGETPCGLHPDHYWDCHRQMATFVHDARMSAAAFLDFNNEEVPPTLRRFLPRIVADNRAIARLLKETATAEDARATLGKPAGRKAFVDALKRVRALEEGLAEQYAELAAQRDWDRPPRLPRSRSRKEKRRKEKEKEKPGEPKRREGS